MDLEVISIENLALPNCSSYVRGKTKKLYYKHIDKPVMDWFDKNKDSLPVLENIEYSLEETLITKDRSRLYIPISATYKDLKEKQYKFNYTLGAFFRILFYPSNLKESEYKNKAGVTKVYTTTISIWKAFLYNLSIDIAELEDSMLMRLQQFSISLNDLLREEALIASIEDPINQGLAFDNLEAFYNNFNLIKAYALRVAKDRKLII